GKLLRAEKEYRRYLTTSPDDPDVIMLLGVLKGEAKQNAAAIALLRKAVQFAPASAAAHYNLGRALLDEGASDSIELALQHLMRSIELVPDRAESHSCLGNAYTALRSNRQAVGAYKRALELDPRCPGASFNLGKALRRLYRDGEAVAALLTATLDD